MKIIYKQRFREHWLNDEKYSNWLSKVEENDEKCFCRLCHTTFVAKLWSIDKHKQTYKHRKKEEVLKALIANEVESENIVVGPQYFQDQQRLETKSQIPMRKIKVVKTEGIAKGNVDYSLKTSNERNHSSETVPKLRTLASLPHKTQPMDDEHSYENYDEGPTTFVTYAQQNEDDECDFFCRSLSAQMKQLPENYVVQAQMEIQNIVAKLRLHHLNNSSKSADEHQNIPSTMEINSY